MIISIRILTTETLFLFPFDPVLLFNLKDMKKTPTKKNETPDSLHKEASIGFLGFSIFDFIHLVTATFALVYAYCQRPILEMDAACSSVEICFAFLLITFVLTMVKKTHQAASLRRYFGFCCVVASLAVFVPSTFWIPETVNGDWGIQESIPVLVLTILNCAFSFVAVIGFAVAQMVDERTTGGLSWRKIAFVANIFFILGGATGVVCAALENKFPLWLTMIECIGRAAPLFPGVLIFWRLSRPSEATDLY